MTKRQSPLEAQDIFVLVTNSRTTKASTIKNGQTRQNPGKSTSYDLYPVSVRGIPRYRDRRWREEIEMNDPYFENRFKTSDIVEGTDEGASNPVVSLDPFADKDPVDPAQIVEIPMGGTVAPVGPFDKTIVDEAQLGEAMDQEDPIQV